MEKIKIKLKEIKDINLKYNGYKITLKSYIGFEQYEIIFNDITENVIKNDEITDKISMIKIRFAKDVLELITNVDNSEFDLNDYFATDIVNILSNNIKNYDSCLKNIMEEYNLYSNLKNTPSAKEINNVIGNITKMVEEIDDEKLNTILKGIAFDKMPLANFISKSNKKEDK